MNRIHKLFEGNKNSILSIFYTAGFPTLKDTVPIAKALEKAGADIGFEKALLDWIVTPVHAADTYAELLPHAAESIYMRTDHHWTGLGAYYGYRAWCAAAGIEPVPLDDLEHKVRPPKTGSFYRATKDPTLLKSADAMRHVFHATGHYRNGILLTPLTADLVADLVLDRREHRELSLTNPVRFGL